MSNPLKQMIRKGLARCGLSLVKSRQLSGLMTAQSLLPDASSPPSADYVPDAQIGTAGFSLNVEGQLTFLTKLCSSSFQDLFASLRRDPNINIRFHDHRGRSRPGLTKPRFRGFADEYQLVARFDQFART